MKARAQWVDGRMFVGESGSGHSVVMDGAPDSGGRNAGIRPMEMLLIGLCGCTAFDVVLILERGREEVSNCVVEAEAERAETDPKVFTRDFIPFRSFSFGRRAQPWTQGRPSTFQPATRPRCLSASVAPSNPSRIL